MVDLRRFHYDAKRVAGDIRFSNFASIMVTGRYQLHGAHFAVIIRTQAAAECYASVVMPRRMALTSVCRFGAGRKTAMLSAATG